MKFFRKLLSPPVLLVILIILVYYQFFFLGKIPIPGDTLIGGYFPWLDYKWGFPTGVAVKNPPISDVFSAMFLWKYLAADILKSGNWPLWNPYSASGLPLLATYDSTALLPFNILLMLPRYYGWGLYIFAQTLIAALGMYFLLGLFIKNSWAKILGSLVFSLSSLMTTWVEFGTGVWAASFLPWIFFFLESFVKTSKIRFLMLMSLSFTFLILSGHAQLTVYSSLLFLVYLVYLFTTKQLSLLHGAKAVMFWLIGISSAAIALLPAQDLVSSSVRGAEAYSKEFNFGLNPWYEVVRFFAADFFGNPATYNHFDTVSYHEQTSFLGTLTLPIIVPLVLKGFRSKLTNFWLIIFLGSIFAVFDNPLTHWFYSLPLPFLTYSSASRTFFVTALSAGVLVGLSIQKLLSEEEKYKKYLRYASAGLLIIITTISLFLLFEKLPNSQTSIRNLIIPILLLLVSLAATFFIKKKSLLAIIFVMLIFFDLSRYFLKYNPFVSNNLVFPTTPVINYLTNQPGLFRISRADPKVMPPATWTQYKLSSIEGYDPLSLENYSRLFNILNGNQYSGGVSRYVELKRYDSNFLDALNTKYLLAVKDKDGKLDKNLSRFKSVFEDKSTVVLENLQVKDRAYFVSNVIGVKGIDDMAKIIENKDFDPTKTAVTLGEVGFNNLPTDGSLNINVYQPNYVRVDTVTKNTSFLVLADTYEKGWQLKRNGQQQRIFEVNGALRGIIVPEGQNKFEFYYWPKSFDLGLKVSSISILALTLLSVISIKKKIW